MYLMQCDAHNTCLKDCIAKQVIDIDKVSNEDRAWLCDPGSCWHDEHTDNKYREASIRPV